MEICNSIADVKKIDASVLTIGSFDGIHRGHFKILDKLNQFSTQKSLPSVMVSFNPHPKYILNKKFATRKRLLTCPDRKMKLIEKMGVDYLWLIPFDLKFADISAETFLNDYLINNFHPADIVIGYDHHFGHNRRGDADFLMESQDRYNFKLHIIDPVSLDGTAVSSTLIRTMLSNCQISLVNQFLGWDYELTGTIIPGDGRGKQLDFPTANLLPDTSEQTLPGKGVYCVNVNHDGNTFTGMCNIGTRPTFYEDGEETIEIHIFTDQSINLYNQKVTLIFKNFIRKENKYNNSAELTRQLELDKQLCLEN